MGRGSYHGGSTILLPGSDWFSKSEPRSKKRKRHSQSAASEVNDQALPSPSAMEIQLLKRIVHASLNAAPMPTIPESWRRVLEPRVARFGTLADWTVAHPEYQRLLSRAQAKAKAKSARPPPVPTAKTEKPHTQRTILAERHQAIEAQINSLRDQIAELETRRSEIERKLRNLP